MYHNLFTHSPVDDIWIASSYQLLWMKWLWTFEYKPLCGHVFSFLLDYSSRTMAPKDAHPLILKPVNMVCILSCFSHIWLCDPWTVVCHASLSMGFSRQKYWSGLLFPSPGDLPDPGIEPVSPEAPVFQAESLLLEPIGKPVNML